MNHEDTALCPFCGSEQTHLIAVQVDAGHGTNAGHTIAVVLGEDGKNGALTQQVIPPPLHNHAGSAISIWRSCEWEDHQWIERLAFCKGDTYREIYQFDPKIKLPELWRS